LAELFGVDVRTVSYHLKEVYASEELTPAATLRKVWRVQREGSREVRREIELYNLDAIISVGYRVNSAQAARQIPMKMADWVAKLDAFLQFNEYQILGNAGNVSAEVAKRLAEERYDKYRVRQDREFESEFEAEVKRIEAKRPGRRKE
jgi:hypothetical protein